MLTKNPNDDLGIGFYTNPEGLSVRSVVGLTLMWVYSAIFDVFAISLFFFISGFFVVRSFDKKKKSAFLFDRLKRMGIPSVCYAFIFGPYLSYAMSGWLMIGEYIPSPNPIRNSGVTWFLNTLLLFNVAYAYLCGEGWTVDSKFSVRTIFLSTTAVGIVEAVIRLFITEGNHVFGILRFFYAGCMYVPVFCGGAIAYRNDWMSGIKEMSRVTKIALYIGCIIHIIFVFLLTWYGYYKWISLQSYGVQSVIKILLSAFILDQGAPTALWMLSITTFFMDHMNFEIETFSLTKTLSKAAYTAYLIQFMFPLQASLASITAILNAQGKNVHFSLDNLYIVFPQNYVFSYYLLTCLLAVTFDWLLAILIVSIPGVSQVL